ncbi:MAG: 2-amino-4-hydroxy-6-hydroxymethyldihydropteridine diphosphokinase [Syntrophales bacterium]|nr:2-amino-4-hydroxy-6-hydroxymethyldihydropteridine diphosphokinase [Syntrophales bacterium]
MDDGVVCFLGIGSNMGNPAANCAVAERHISDRGGVTVLRRSSLYRTQPVGFEEQAWFVNGVIEVRTALRPRPLMDVILGVEDEMGRIRNEKWGPRIIDIDVLFYGQAVIEEKDLVIPHPRLHERRFVLVPMNEIAPHVIHPAFGVSVRGLLDRLQDTNTVEWLSGEWDRSCG